MTSENPGPPGKTPGISQRRVVVAGFGPVGRTVTQALESAGFGVTIVELNPQTVRTQTQLGKHVVKGDISETAVLETAGIRTAHALILTIPDEEASLSACRRVRHMAPDIFIAVRANHISNGMRATKMGADHVAVQEVITAQSMQEAVMARLVGEGGRPAMDGGGFQGSGLPAARGRRCH